MNRLTTFMFVIALLLLSSVAGAYPKQPAWVKRSVEDVTIEAPAAWTWLEQNDLAQKGIAIPPEQREKAVLYFLTYPGAELGASDCLIGMGRVRDPDLASLGTLGERKEIVVSGQNAVRFSIGRGKDQEAMKGYVVVLNTPHSDGKTIGLVFFCKATTWISYEPVFNYMLETLTIGGGGPPPVNGVYGVVTTNMKPIEDVTVLIGENLKLKVDAGFTDVLTGEALFLETKTDAKGQYSAPLPPGFYSIVFWKRGYVPVHFERVPVPPGKVNTDIGPDNQVGSTGRHQGINVDAVRKETPLGQPGVTGVRGRIKLSDEGQHSLGRDVTVLVGRDLALIGDSPTDTAWGTLLVAELTTDEFGRFHLPLPPGPHDLLIWKKRHVPEQIITVTVRPNSFFVPQAAYVNMRPPDVGVYNTTLTFDHQPGGTGRHLDLDLRRLPRLQGAAGANVVATGTIRLSDRGLRLPGAGATVIFGQELAVQPGAAIVQVSGKQLVSATADADGRYVAKLPAGTYQVVVWKAGYRPDGPVTVKLPEEGGVNRTLLRDPAVDPEKQRLEMNDLAPPKSSAPPASAPPAFLPTAGLLLAQRPVEAVVCKSGDVTIAVPKAWLADPTMPKEEGRWFLGDPDAPTAALSILRDGDFSGLILAIADRASETGKIAGQDGTIVEGKLADDQVRLVIFAEPRADGRKLAILAAARTQRWSEFEPSFARAFESLQLAGGTRVSPVPPPPPPVGPEVSLPEDPNAPVVIFDYVGGLTLPRKTNDPMLTIYAGGRVKLIDPFGRMRTIESTLTRENLLQFMKFALVEHKFFQLDDQKIEQAIRERQARGGPIITDLPKTMIHLRTRNSEGRVGVRGPQMYSEAFPEMESLRHMAAIAVRLERYVDSLREKHP